MNPPTRTFTQDDQDAFARLSGDFNPAHVDAIAARRLMFGRPVVHGVHALIWAIDSWLGQRGDRMRLAALRATFRGPVVVGEAVTLGVKATGDGVKLDLASTGVSLLTAKLTLTAAGGNALLIPSTFPPHVPCKEPGEADLSSISGQLVVCLEAAAAASLFANATRCLPAEQIATLLGITRLVGMDAPGLHSILTGLDLTASDSRIESSANYRSEGYDGRFRMLTLHVEGPGLAGRVMAALRPAPAIQPSMNELRQHVIPGEFNGVRALVIGGSRGLGEVIAKALAAGGADVKLTYHRGIEDAARVTAEIIEAGGQANHFAFDVHQDPAHLRERLDGWNPTLLAYLATPVISSSAARRFSYERFLQFGATYIDGFSATVNAVNQPGDLLHGVLCPSSIFAEELPLNMGEYAVAKRAMEALCEFLAKAHPAIRFHHPRIPRLATDQTASLLPVDSSDIISVAIASIRDTLPRERPL